MGFALRLFSRHVSSLRKSSHILWVFSGTRPNLGLEMKVASSFGEPFTIVDSFCDFTVEDISKILSNYNSLGSNSEGLEEKMAGLCGPPKLLYWFLLLAQKIELKEFSDLRNKWEDIEIAAISLYEQQILSTIKSFGLLGPEKLNTYARELCYLHTHAFMNYDKGYLELIDLPDKWIPFIESGLIRVRKIGGVWKLFPPNCFLAKIFFKYVDWFTMPNVEHLVSAVKFSVHNQLAKGKVFEYLFALELCSPTLNSPLWDQLGKLKLKPYPDWKPSIDHMGDIELATDRNKVYVMSVPVRSNSKTDVLFFAQDTNSETIFRVLVQLTIQEATNSTVKAFDTFAGMLQVQTSKDGTRFDVPGNEGIEDFMLFICPKSRVKFARDHEKTFNSSNCRWLDSLLLDSPLLRFSLDFCDPVKSESSLNFFFDLAISSGDSKLAEWIKPTTNKRKREVKSFDSMDLFYEALGEYGLNEDRLNKVKAVIEHQDILPKQLATLTDVKLEKYGLTQGGLREAVLSVIES